MDDPLSRHLHRATRDVHERAERSALMAGLIAGTRSVGDWSALLSQLLAVYEALEGAAVRWSEDPAVRPFLHPALPRTSAIRADLVALGGDLDPELVPATRHYVAAITHAGPAGFVAHHWVRYLGDLSGGQALRVLLGRSLGLTADQLRFYDFGALGPKPFKDEYHRLLDAAPWPADQVASEAVRAFELNVALFDELDARADRPRDANADAAA